VPLTVVINTCSVNGAKAVGREPLRTGANVLVHTATEHADIKLKNIEATEATDSTQKPVNKI
jgi:hypothetical protein